MTDQLNTFTLKRKPVQVHRKPVAQVWSDGKSSADRAQNGDDISSSNASFKGAQTSTSVSMMNRVKSLRRHRQKSSVDTQNSHVKSSSESVKSQSASSQQSGKPPSSIVRHAPVSGQYQTQNKNMLLCNDICDRCIDRMDHHCLWMANCVGRRNYRYFYLFIVSTIILDGFGFVFPIIHLVVEGMRTDGGVFMVIAESPITLVLSVLCAGFFFSLSVLFGYHTWLISQDMTTNEHIKRQWSSDNQHLSYGRGNVFVNAVWVLCRPIAPIKSYPELLSEAV
ncbi:hypothetical protein MP228_002016 [Amoeboaphelidium protococcarum]|nr:hypothetical protein MP228_002016 [Amoeboaphelidium protococcarum]